MTSTGTALGASPSTSSAALPLRRRSEDVKRSDRVSRAGQWRALVLREGPLCWRRRLLSVVGSSPFLGLVVSSHSCIFAINGEFLPGR
ncbi:hypothetical protein E2C01_013849 [Portunus trituberculatus]|uniref:Uncharacterized protein n=1 Tax=Portunus trituberculatus TaxID=210409 RepID=A0A5B7DI78_PORTR|nr:hypothetical protein [Portunus trituberculatus]